MTDRDLLAADLHEIACGASARAEWDLCVRDHRHEADRLIALGWTRHPLGTEEAIAQAQRMLAASETAADREITRLHKRVQDLNTEVLDRMDQWHRDSLARDELARQQNREITRLRNLVGTLDEERLARALLRAVPGYQRWMQWPVLSWNDAAGRADAAESEALVHAAAIAKAYREDTDADD